ncbi:hypothetical protein Trco_002076 [Trichoderma cornu-damae]|uniref:Uncharacterized protein n=1 Tax=Trichoderma cornu-damae TaxID=654480 RepID=A0A9P8QS42_9HYPO|nr:hypothetical protein Trco_002076 [Trichoderma cornu-damae]
MATTASAIVSRLTASSSSSPSSTTAPTISLVKPRTSRHAETITAPIIISGLRRPQGDVLSSAKTPTMGWTMRPESGPAIQTSDVLLLVPTTHVIPIVQNVKSTIFTVSELPLMEARPFKEDAIL